MKHSFSTLILAAAVAAFFPAGVSASEGEALYSGKGCAACHGADAKSPINPGYPKLAGQSRDYLVRQIQDIKSGARDNGLTAQMKPIVQALTDAEIESIAEYLSGL